MIKNHFWKVILICFGGWVLLALVVFAYRGYLFGDPVFSAALRKSRGDVVAALKDVGRYRENEQGEIESLALTKSIFRNRGGQLRHNNSVLRYVKEIQSIKSLGIGANTDINDAGMKHIAEMKQLESLNLNGVKITDRGLKQLESLENLKKISLYATKITPQGVERFRQAVPGCEVLYGSVFEINE